MAFKCCQERRTREKGRKHRILRQSSELWCFLETTVSPQNMFCSVLQICIKIPLLSKNCHSESAIDCMYRCTCRAYIFEGRQTDFCLSCSTMSTQLFSGLLPSSCLTLGKSLSLSGIRLSHLMNDE